jgi:hypothetical protein
LVTAISFFASTMSRGMVQAFIVALLFPIALAVSADLLLENFLFGSYALVLGGRLFSTLVWPALLASYFWLAFRNFKQLQTGWRLWAGNFIRLAVVFASVMLAAGAIFDRSWELFMSLEPSTARRG